jgi:Arc/MetJ family transcription regulator
MTAAPNCRAAPSNAYPARISSSWAVDVAGYPAGGFSLTFGTLVRLVAPCAGSPGAPRAAPAAYPYSGGVIFKKVGEGRPYPDHGKESPRDWADVPPRMVRLDELVTTKRNLDLGLLLAEDSTFYGDLFAHVVEWEGTLYLEDGLHRALRAALQQRPTLHARVLVLD